MIEAISLEWLVQKSDLFADNLPLTVSPYNVTSQVLLSDFQEFISALEGASVRITNKNFGGLSLLCDEFRFRDLARQLSEFRESGEFKEEAATEDSGARKRISALEERMHQRDQEIGVLQSKLSRQAEAHESAIEALLGRVGRLEAEVMALRSTTETVTEPTLTQLQIDLRTLKDAMESLAARPPPSATPSPVPASPLPATSTRPVLSSPSGWNSVIVPNFPEIFAEFKAKKLKLLWRGSRDGFQPSDFHKRCNGHPNTLTVILDTDGNIFGGYTPVKWESPKKQKYKADPDRKSVV
jgi:archaellum component FlaC